MKPMLFIFQLTLVLSLSGNTYAAECDSQCQDQLVENYFTLLDKVYRESSKESDITNLFELFDSGVKYEHLAYEANFDRNSWMEAFKGNLERGAYKGSPEDKTKVTNIIFGKQHVAVEYKYGKISKNGKWSPTDDKGLFALFEFKDNKITLVREYW